MKPVISEDGSATAYSDTFQQTYHSTHGALTESRLVYLQNSGIADALRQGQPCRVLEVGFGLGLNFITTAVEALQSGATLHYVALERDLISASVFRALNYGELLPEAHALTDALAAKLENSMDGNLYFRHGLIELTVLHGDALQAELPGEVDAVYQDAFSPDTNGELWTTDFLRRLCDALKPGGTLTTYCVKGDVRRALGECGMQVRKLPGPPGKREVLLATKPAGA